MQTKQTLPYLANVKMPWLWAMAPGINIEVESRNFILSLLFAIIARRLREVKSL